MTLFARLVTVAVLCGVASVSAAEEKSALFNGKDLSGWQGDATVFRVEEGAIVGGSKEKPLKQNEFLVTEKEFGDFELTLKFRIEGESANAGVQIRSQRVPNHNEMVGYQADIGQGFWGCLYDESRRNVVLARPTKETIQKALKRGDWNDYRIRCEGKRVQLWLNGVQTVDYTEADDTIVQRGRIGLQVHSGPPMQIHYKDLQIAPLNSKKD